MVNRKWSTALKDMVEEKALKHLQEHTFKLEAKLHSLWSKGYVYEDDLPDISEEEYHWLFQFSKVDGVRLFPKVLVDWYVK